MPLTLEDLDRRVTALEKAAEREKSVERAVSEIVSESEQRLDDRIGAAEKRLDDRMGAAEKRFTDLLNERFDQVMVALDKLHNPPK
jgi:vacuolar-type H+-ATPase subunit H